MPKFQDEAFFIIEPNFLIIKIQFLCIFKGQYQSRMKEIKFRLIKVFERKKNIDLVFFKRIWVFMGQLAKTCHLVNLYPNG